MFHDITGCDTVSFFGGKGEKTAWDVWNVYPVLTNVLCRLMLFPEKVEDTFMAVIERFVALLYNRTSAIVEVNPARKDLFLKKAKSLEKTPTNTSRTGAIHNPSTFSRSIHLGSSAPKQPVIPTPSTWRWEKEGISWKPKWMTLPQAKDTCYELIHCGYKVAGATGNA